MDDKLHRLNNWLKNKIDCYEIQFNKIKPCPDNSNLIEELEVKTYIHAYYTVKEFLNAK